MNTKELIKLNNQKRKQLTKENEAYYDDMLVYIRTHLFLSERQSEELLMELLNHLLDAQAEGKTAKDVFGDDPKTVCDEMIEELPKEQTKNAAAFIFYLSCKVIGYIMIISGVGDLIFSIFKSKSSPIYIGTEAAKTILSLLIIFAAVWMIFLWLKSSVYKRFSKFKSGIIVGSISCLFLFDVLLVSRLIPAFGPEIHINGLFCLCIGLFIIIIATCFNRKFQIV
ncbi:DNA-binding ferritin-like protein (Dps family) [Scopulibacillus daqui]|uniref:DNA-binding ferritin-like protein (Dps family) n=1 Tax=Scopulibacillus daqui TaxID=1469162 RepID=A0ABS2Q3F6_9BACL|nr:DUF1129 family protein [Scopulibacillus daqui]MBM7646839.1 DNA-binding ferritin-like protein (Dps family) [Scopulibacillus daqui]